MGGRYVLGLGRDAYATSPLLSLHSPLSASENLELRNELAVASV